MQLGGGYPYRTQLLVTMVFLSLKDLTHSQGIADYTLTVQQNVTVQEGLCVTVPCTFTIDSTKKLSTNAMGYWRKCSYTNKDKCSAEPPPDKQPRIHTTNVSNGDCSFTLNDPDKRDTGKYEFRIEDGVDQALKFRYVNNATYITVTDLTDRPEIILPEVMVAGEDVSLTCRSPGRSCGTPPIFTWERNGDQATFDPLITCGEKKMSLSDCKEPKITLRLSWNDHQTSITCNVTLPAVERSTSKTITLNVQYVLGNQDILRCEGTNILFVIVCIVAGNVLILILTGLGLFWYVKRIKASAGKGIGSDGQKTEMKESNYQDLRFRCEDVYQTVNGEQLN